MDLYTRKRFAFSHCFFYRMQKHFQILRFIKFPSSLLEILHRHNMCTYFIFSGWIQIWHFLCGKCWSVIFKWLHGWRSKGAIIHVWLYIILQYIGPQQLTMLLFKTLRNGDWHCLFNKQNSYPWFGNSR